MSNQISAIIFSKDRACQLSLLLDSIKKNASGIYDDFYIIVKTSSEEFVSAYSKLFLTHSGLPLHFISEHNFKENVKEAINNCHNLVGFFTDDDIIYRKFPVKQEKIIGVFNEELVGTLSLRLGLNTKFQCPYSKTPMAFPAQLLENDEFLMYNSLSGPFTGNFFYRFSVDGNIYRKSDLLKLVDKFDFDTPNSFEGAAQHYLQDLPVISSCFRDSILVNTPINRVQESFQNAFGKMFGKSQQSLNELYLSGYHIRLDKIDFSGVDACHVELPMELSQ